MILPPALTSIAPANVEIPDEYSPTTKVLVLTSVVSAAPALIVIVFSAPDPDATTPDPTKSNVVATVDNALPSSLTVIPPVTFEILDPSPCKKFE